ncbi:MAG: hypothetical protein J7L53_05605 [Deltaproteobacteria bacterium]|nr:hypothetical protein [Deltaproteobacteria bacterium]
MKIRYGLEEIIAVLQERVTEVEKILDSEINKTIAPKWMTRTIKTLTKIFGQDDQYVKNFKAIDLHTPFMVETLSPVIEEDNRLALEDARIFLISLMDELESEYKNAPGVMDMESIFVEINRYVSNRVHNSLIKDDLRHRVARLRDGLLSGDITGVEVERHIRWIGDIDSGLFERLVPLLAWFYIYRDDFSEVYNN